MRLLLRLRVDRDRATVDWHDVEVLAPDDVTVTEIAAALHPLSHAAVPGTPSGPVTLRGPDGVLPPGAAARDVGPPSGAEVTVVPPDPNPPIRRPDPSPVTLVGPAGDRRELHCGANPVDAAEVLVGPTLTVGRPRPGHVAVNGAPVVAPRPLAHGDLLRTSSGVWTVVIDGPLPTATPPGTHRTVHHVPAWTVAPVPADLPPVQLPTPPSPPRHAGLPWLSTAVPVALGLGLWWATRSALAAVFMLLSGVLLLATTLEGRREARREHRGALARYEATLDAATVEVHRRVDARRVHLDLLHPPAQAWLVDRGADPATARPTGPPRWGHRSPVLRLGTGPVPTEDLLTDPAPGAVPADPRTAEVLDAGRAPTLPVLLDLSAAGGLAVVGDPATTEPVLRSLVAQLALSCPPAAWRIRIAGPPGWAAWLPHTDPAGTAGSTVAVGGPGPVALGANDVLLWHGPPDSVPPAVGAVLHLLPDGTSAVLRRPDAPDQPVTTEPLGRRDAVALARSLAPLRPDDAPAGGAAATTLRSVLASGPAGSDTLTDPGATRARWAASALRNDLSAPVATVGGSVVHVDLRVDGPHALVAGTTGAGKSELLRTLVTALALHHGPDRCTFLLVDYKGGAAFGPLTGLPHTVGLVTDLDGPLAERALVSLRAELRHRERRAAAGGAPPPSLVVVVDEFAALVREVPGFVDGLLDVAQRGRSLGLHLVLATQHPRGVVTDAIRANTALRIALRTVDGEASSDVVDVPDAASLPASRPGRAVLRTAGAPPAVVQAAWSGAPATVLRTVRVRPLGQAASVPDSAPALGAGHGHDGPAAPDQLTAAVDAVRHAARGLPSPRRPWVDPLPEHLALEQLTVPTGPGRVAVGRVDRPADQRTDELVVDLCAHGGVVVLGAARSGRSTALRTLAVALADHPTEAVHIDAIDAHGTLGDLSAWRATGAVVPVHDDERVVRLLRRLARLVEVRRGDPRPDAGPRRVLLVDDVRALLDRHERRGTLAPAELLEHLATDGPPHGVHLAVTARRPLDLPPSLAAALGCRVLLRPAHPDDAALLGLPESDADPATPAGRGRSDGHAVQLAVGSRPADRPDRPAADDVPTLGTVLLASTCAHPCAPWRVPVGVEADELTTRALDLTHAHAVVAGIPRSGVSSALDSLAGRAGVRAVLVTDRVPTGPGHWDVVVDPGEVAADPDVLRGLVGSGPCLVAVDDAHRLLDDVHLPLLDGALADLAGDHAGVRLVLAGSADHLGRLFGRTWSLVRAGRTGVLLRPDPDLHGPLLHAVLPRRDELTPTAGRGWVVSPDGCAPVQLWLPPEPHHRRPD